MAVNSGAAQMAGVLGPEGKGLVFTQVVPFPWSVAVPVVKEYQQALASTQPRPRLRSRGSRAIWARRCWSPDCAPRVAI